MKCLLFALAAALVGNAQPPERPHILGSAHVAPRVADIGKLRAFYKDFLGFEERGISLPVLELDAAPVELHSQRLIARNTGTDPTPTDLTIVP